MSRCAVAALGVAALLLTACGTDPATAAEVAAEAERVLEERTGVPSEVTCPDELPAEVGADVRCRLAPEGDTQAYGVTVTVTRVDGDALDLDVRVDEQPEG
ncbi:DUF4333 domain-containing protein [Blastococcus sp. TF02A-35]|uniref:DUF4333 domain-containing protein n=1 Tax=Blastococcus sp. TF02A-35 TaxID=2559612 RepID=UPI001073F562|nr:DUF4333 domain-containing protein [Blastococcus sp. TF02A_35]TFV53831.1 DUF4333 domain-containing protein [Blastococcus sp. TF02A_35]